MPEAEATQSDEEAEATAPESSAPAWTDPATAAQWKRSARRTAIALVIGLLLGAVFVVYIQRLSDHTADLWDRGVSSSGEVLADPADTLRCRQVAVPVRFAVGGETEVHRFYVDSCGSGLQAGDVVRVRYDPDDPGNFLVNGESSEAPGPTLLAIIALVGSVFGLVGGTGYAISLARRFLILRRHPWRKRPARVAPLRSAWVRGFAAIELLDIEPHRALISGAIPVTGARDAAPTELRVAGSDHGSVVIESTKVLGLAHPPRWFGGRRRVTRSLERAAARRSPDGSGQPSALT